MKKILFTLLIVNVVTFSTIAAIVPNPIVSRNKPVYTSSGPASYLVDNKFNTSSWNVTDSSWIAIKVDSGPSKLFFTWNNPSYAWSNQLAPSQCPNSISFPVDYNILTSSNSTNGADGDWTIADSIRGNIVSARGHLINFSGKSWVKMQIIKGGGQIDEVEAFDASSGDEDVWFFAGTSISANAFKGTPPSPDFADVINQKHPEYDPAMIRGGIGCITSTDFVNNLSYYLKMAGNAHYWAIEMGTNDAWGGTNSNAATFKSNLQRVIDSCKANGIVPIIARVLATNKSLAKWQVHPDFLKAVDDLTKQNNLISGPDLYTWFLTHPEELNSDGVHPNASGAKNLQRLWAEKLDSLYGGCSATEIFPYIQVNRGDSSILASVSVNEGDTVTLSPQASDGGSWSWNGPGGFSSESRQVSIKNIETSQGGYYNVTYTNIDSCTSSYRFKISVKAAATIVLQPHFDNISFYPNPVYHQSKFTVILNNLCNGSQLQIYNLQGKLAYSSALTQKETEINAGLVEGIYIIRIINGHSVLNKKFIVK